MPREPFRFVVAARLCRLLPPVFAARVGNFLYPPTLAKEANFHFIVNALSGSRLLGSTSDHHALGFALRGYYDWRVVAIAHAVCIAGDTVIDVGANIGTESIAFADIVGPRGKVLCFEPVPYVYEMLKQNIRLNGYDFVDAKPMAVGERSGKVQFMQPRNAFLSGSGHMLPDTSSEESISVSCTTIDSWENQLSNCRLIHVDAEGSEIFVLRGARDLINRERPVLILEVSPKHFARHGLSTYDLFDLTREYHYRAYRLRRVGTELIDSTRRVNTERMANWVCLPDENSSLAQSINRVMYQSYFMPCIRPLNPMMS